MRPLCARLGDGGVLSYRLLGDPHASTPVMLHRPLGGSMALWGELGTLLGAVFPVILFDPRGVGASSAAPLGDGTRDMAHDAVELLDALGVTRAHLFGLSLGGMVASWMAIDAPSRVDRVVLVSTLPRAATISHHVRRHVGPIVRAFFRHGAAAEIGLVRDVLSRAFRDDHPRRMQEIDALVRGAPSTHRNLVARSLAAALHDASADLARMTAPALLIFGDRDEIAGKHARHELAGDIPGAEVEIMPDAGHDISLEQPRLLAARVIAFLSAH